MPEPLVIVDWRPYDIPDVYGPFENEEMAYDYAVQIFNLERNDDLLLPDGIDIRSLGRPI